MERHLRSLNAQILSLNARNALERKALSRDVTLETALRGLPGKWTGPMCEALDLHAGSKDKERKAAILFRLTSDGSMKRVWERLPGPARLILSWLVIEKQGCSSARELYERFGPDDDISYHWNKGQLPTTPLGILRLHGLTFKGTTGTARGREKVVVVPADLRADIEEVTRGAKATRSAPPMPPPAFINETGLWDPLEWSKTVWTPRPRSSTYQFLVVLREVEPVVWRRIQVPGDYSFWDLHVAIQDAMGWLDYHLHEYRLNDPVRGNEVIVGIQDSSFDDRITLPDHLIPVADYFPEGPVEYLYDFGDDWFHEVTLEASWQDLSIERPGCVGGERACPPEDCGGPPGYEEFLRVISDADDEEHEEMLDWVGGSFDPERFDPRSVHFDNPTLRFFVAFFDDEEAREQLDREREAARERAADSTWEAGQGNPAGAASFTGWAPSAQRKSAPEIEERERLVVESAVRSAGMRDFRVLAGGDSITVFLADFDMDDVTRMQDAAGLMILDSSEGIDLEDMFPPADAARRILEVIQHYTSYLRFTLEQGPERRFSAERMVFLDPPDWMPIGDLDTIENLADRYCRHLGKDSFFDLE